MPEFHADSHCGVGTSVAVETTNLTEIIGQEHLPDVRLSGSTYSHNTTRLFDSSIAQKSFVCVCVHSGIQ